MGLWPTDGDANRHRYVGKETSRRWEQGDDPSIVDFRCAEYSDGKLIANVQIRERIAEIGIRKTARMTQVDSKTITAIVRGEPVKRITFAKVVRFINGATCRNGSKKEKKKTV